MYALPKVNKVMRKSDFLNLIEDMEAQKYNENRRQSQLAIAGINETQEESTTEEAHIRNKKREEVGKLLSTSKSVSFNDLVEIKNVVRLISAAIFLTINMQIVRIKYKQATMKKRWDVYLLNTDLIGGLCILVIGIVSSTSKFHGRRITLMVIGLLLSAVVNIIWVSFSDIYEIQDANLKIEKGNVYLLEDLQIFDLVMFQANSALCYMSYYVIIVAGPVDICKTYMLQKNQRIYALLICFIGGCKYIIDAMVFDDHISSLSQMDFFEERLLIITFNFMAIACLITIVREEVGEIIHNMDKRTELSIYPLSVRKIKYTTSPDHFYHDDMLAAVSTSDLTGS